MYKYKYKYKYGSMDPGTIRAKNSLLYAQKNFTSELGQPEGITGEPIPGYEGSAFYSTQHPDRFFTMYPGQRTANLGNEWNDKVGAVMVGSRNKVTVYEHSDFGGRDLPLTSGFHTLPRICTRLGSRGQCLQWFDWKQKVSSIKVEPS
jgi:hypothetical protein